MAIMVGPEFGAAVKRLYRAVGVGLKPWHGAVHAMDVYLYSTGAKGELWVGVWCPGIKPFAPLRIPPGIFKGLAAGTYDGAKLQDIPSTGRTLIQAHRSFLFRTVRQDIGRLPPKGLRWEDSPDGLRVVDSKAQARAIRVLRGPLRYGVNRADEIVLVREQPLRKQ